MDLRVIPAEPWAAARERYRALAAEPRPGDPRAAPEPPPRRPFATVTAVQFAACALFVAAAWLILLNA